MEKVNFYEGLLLADQMPVFIKNGETYEQVIRADIYEWEEDDEDLYVESKRQFDIAYYEKKMKAKRDMVNVVEGDLFRYPYIFLPKINDWHEKYMPYLSNTTFRKMLNHILDIEESLNNEYSIVMTSYLCKVIDNFINMMIRRGHEVYFELKDGRNFKVYEFKLSGRRYIEECGKEKGVQFLIEYDGFVNEFHQTIFNLEDIDVMIVR